MTFDKNGINGGHPQPPQIPGPSVDCRTQTVEFYGFHPAVGLFKLPVPWRQMKAITAQLVLLDCQAQDNAEGHMPPHPLPDGYPVPGAATAAPKIVPPTAGAPVSPDLMRRIRGGS